MFTTNNNHLLDINLHFFCRSNHTYKNGANPIVLRITYRKQRRDIMTGLSCPIEDWVTDFQGVRSSTRIPSPINRELQTISLKVTERFHELKYSGNVFTIDELVERIRGKEAPPQTMIEYIDGKLSELRERAGLDLADSTYYKYQRTARYLNDFLSFRRGVKNILVGKVVDGEFLKHLFLYLRKEKFNHNSAVALMNCLKTILRKPVRNGTINRNPFDEFPLTQKTVHRNFLDMEEIKKLQDLENLPQPQDVKRDLFLFASFTGLAYSDIKGLKPMDILTDPDGTISIRDPRQKTGVMSIIPLLPVAQRILKKYSNISSLNC